jgi:TonB family protein
MRMVVEIRMGTVVSVVCHGILILCLLVFSFWNPLNSKEEIPVMELVQFPDGTEVTMGENTSPPPALGEEVSQPAEDTMSLPEPAPRPTLDIPAMPSIEKLDIPPEPAPPEPVSPPAPQPVPVPQPTPAPKPAPVAPKPAPAPSPAPPKIMSEEEFRKLHGNKKPQPARTPTRPPVVAPTVSTGTTPISVPSISRSKTSGSPSGTAGGSARGVAGVANGPLQENYLNRVRSILDDTWVRPVHLAKGLFAEVEFRVESNGQIVLARFLQTSGNSEFDETVKLAFLNARRAPPSPDGRVLVNKVVFMLE